MAAEAPSLALPLDCGKHACFLQNMVDTDPGPGRRDPFCGAATYDGHKGTDIRVRDLAALRQGIDVLSMAPGRALRVRDGMADRLQRSDRKDAGISGRECGNGVVIDHGNGWTAQFCHMAHGSISVRPGDQVEAGSVLGQMGLSGQTAFPHIHVSLRKDDALIDPMLGVESGQACRADASLEKSLWNSEARNVLSEGALRLLQAGYASAPVNGKKLLLGQQAPATDGSALVLYAKFINLEAGDRVRLTIDGPDGVFAQSTTDPLPRPKASYTAYAGKRWHAGGPYRGTVELLRGGKTVLRESGIAWP